MKTTPMTPGQRHEAWSRLRTMTTGVAMVGIAATAGIGAVAATHHHGKSAGAASVTEDAASGSGGDVTPDPTASPEGAGGSSVDPTQARPALGAPATSAPREAPAPVITPRVRAKTKAHASSGGS
jgi:hypothetical protein